jgi:hypothetical protein
VKAAAFHLASKSVLAFWFALARDGQVRSFLQNDEVQAYYTVAIIVVFAIGVLNLALGLMNMLGARG